MPFIYDQFQKNFNCLKAIFINHIYLNFMIYFTIILNSSFQFNFTIITII
jgi:hypothetical protein